MISWVKGPLEGYLEDDVLAAWWDGQVWNYCVIEWVSQAGGWSYFVDDDYGGVYQKVPHPPDYYAVINKPRVSDFTAPQRRG